MRKRIFVVWALVLGLCAPAAANDHFNAGMKAVTAKDYTTALSRFESALEQEPDNLRFGNEYRQTAMKIAAYDRCIAFFQQLTTKHPKAANAWMNLGYAYVDKIPVEGAITQVLLANTALGHFTTALGIQESWLGFYTRGNSYVFWPAIFGRTPLAIADLEKAIAIAEKGKQKSYHARVWVALGDSYWRLDNMVRAREIWRKALQRFPGNTDLKARLDREGEALNTLLSEHYDPGRRVDTNLRILWEE